MADAREERIEKIALAARELSGEARAAWLDTACAGDPSLRAAVEQRLALSAAGGAAFPGFTLPRTLGEFELLREIGRGGMAIVYLARQASLHREVAVKVLIETPATTARQVERFHRESKAVAKLRHPGIVPVLTDGQIGTVHWFAMEYVAGHDLGREILRQRRSAEGGTGAPFLPGPGTDDHLATVARICADVADALQYAHEHGLVHRDIKPHNLLLQPDGRVQIGDFGLVRDASLGTLTRTGEMAGTPYYMSPEQARAYRMRVDHRTDVYSLGAVLYELCSLRRPFEGTTSAEILSQIAHTEPRRLRQLNRRVPRDLELICATAMAKNPAERYPDARAFAADLRRFLRHEAIEARAPSAYTRTRRWVRRHRKAVAASALLAAGALMGALWTRDALHAAALARLAVEARDADGRAVAGSVRLRRLDPITGRVVAEETLGALPLAVTRLEPGYARVVVDLASGGALESTRELLGGRETRVDTRVAAGQDDTRGMVLVEGGTLSLRENAPLSPLNNADIDVAPFWLDDHEVSNAEYRRFLAATGHAPPAFWAQIVPGVHDELPVVMVAWTDALAYAEWRGKRLPSFAEWTWAARGAEARIYPWPSPREGEYLGNTLQPVEPIVSVAQGMDSYLQDAAPVRSMPEASTASGLFHMFGNVAEWTESPVGMPVSGGFEPRFTERLIAGHHWNAAGRRQSLRTFSFAGIELASADFSVGFRCARSAGP